MINLLRDTFRQIWSEVASLTRNSTASFQTLGVQDDEFFFGGGMQNGRFSHKGHRIRISKDFNWADGGNPNSAPFYLSTAGYGVYRNTWSPGAHRAVQQVWSHRLCNVQSTH